MVSSYLEIEGYVPILITQCVSLKLKTIYSIYTVFVGPCHHVMVRPQVVDEGTASDMEGSCEQIE